MTMKLLLVAALLGYCLAGPTNKHASSKDMEHKQPDFSSETITRCAACVMIGYTSNQCCERLAGGSSRS